MLDALLRQNVGSWGGEHRDVGVGVGGGVGGQGLHVRVHRLGHLLGDGDGFDDGLVSPYKCNSRQIRSDVLVYDTPVLEQDIAIAGPLYAELYAASSAVDTDFIVRVSDVDEQGTARNVSFNIIRAEFRKGWDKPELLTPGKIEKYEMEMYFYGMVFKKGHKIRIDISSSELMEAFPNTNTGIDPYTDPKPIKATQTIYHGREYPSHVKLPVLYGL